jgi:Flp pilus assembly protein TadG
MQAKRSARVEQLLQRKVFRGASPVGIVAMKTAASPRAFRIQSLFQSGKRRIGLRAEGGQSLLELALVLPMLLLLLVGTIEIGRLAYYSIVVANAARAGAQYGAQNLITAADTPGITTAAGNDAGIAGLAVGVTHTCGCTGTVGGVGGLTPACPAAPPCTLPNHALVYIQVTTTYPFTPLFSYHPWHPAPISLSSTEKMRVAQ